MVGMWMRRRRRTGRHHRNPPPSRSRRRAGTWPRYVSARGGLAPVLPTSAVEVGPDGGPARVGAGRLMAVDDTSTTVLQRDGEVTFLANDEVRSKTLGPEPLRGPDSVVVVRGWPAESSALDWAAPKRRVAEVDPRRIRRPLAEPG